MTSIATILKNFYLKSDDPYDHEGYADFFTPDATLVMGLKTFEKREGGDYFRSIDRQEY
jgi:hypothetical protein